MNVRLSVKTTRTTPGHDVQRPPEPEVVTPAEMAGSVASVLSPVAALSIAMLVWRLGVDMGFARKFCISEGLFSHWQTWMALTFSIVTACSRLKRYSSAAETIGVPEAAAPVLASAPVVELPQPEAPSRAQQNAGSVSVRLSTGWWNVADEAPAAPRPVLVRTPAARPRPAAPAAGETIVRRVVLTRPAASDPGLSRWTPEQSAGIPAEPRGPRVQGRRRQAGGGSASIYL